MTLTRTTTDQAPGADDAPAPVREITVILVSWNDAEDLRACVESLAEARRRMPGEGPHVSLVVVQNGGGRAEILSLWPGASVLVNEENRGFGPAANQGADIAPGDVLLFLNPDTRAEGDPFTALSRGFDAHTEAAALAPRLLDYEDPGAPRPARDSRSAISRLAPPDREDQFTFQLRRLPGLASDARELLLVDSLAPNNRGRRRWRYADCDRNSPFEVEQAAAAALAIRKREFQRLQGFDARFVPAWFEDVDLCARLSHAGKLLYWPAAQFRHRGGVSSASLGYPRFLRIYYGNALRYRRLHYKWPARVLYRALLFAGMLLRLLLLPFRPTVPRPRREAARAYLGVLGVALGLSSSHNSGLATDGSHD